MPPVLGRQFVDAGDQQVPLLVAGPRRPGRRLVVVVQPRGLGGGGPDHRDRDVKPLGERVNGGRARRPDQVQRGREGVEGGPGQPAAPRDLAVGPAALVQALLDQPLQWVDGTLRPGRGTFPSFTGEFRLAV